ncbi:MAG TPA: cytochrome c-type biogenesis CcmF C-terminal domain-containing protein, partial [Gemmatimonadales bacterium]|nr:cytochrome c-type biogenesis CcmF C-terminal domain-containing protein [Gemmatimonadales bacterium]
VWLHEKLGNFVREVIPERRQHVNSLGEETFQPSTEVGLKSSLREDIYATFQGSVDGTEKARFNLIVTPLVAWFWIGGAVLVLGGLLAMWPGGPEIRTRRTRRTVAADAESPALAGGGN